MESKRSNPSQQNFYLVDSYKRRSENKNGSLSNSSSDDNLNEAFGIDKSITMTSRVQSFTASDPQADASDLTAQALSFMDEDEPDRKLKSRPGQAMKDKKGKAFAQAFDPSKKKNLSQFSTTDSQRQHQHFKIPHSDSLIAEESEDRPESRSRSPRDAAPSKNLLSKLTAEVRQNSANFAQTEPGFYAPRRHDRQRPNRPALRANTQDYSIDLSTVDLVRKTTLQIANIPNKYTKLMMMSYINQKFSDKYDFFYMPIDFNNMCNKGYAFINFVDLESTKRFYQLFNSTRWPRFHSDKICELRYAALQGKDAYMKFFEKSQVMRLEDDNVKPFIRN